jgi:hypothetical protein
MRRAWGREGLGGCGWTRGLVAAALLAFGAPGVQAQVGAVSGTVADSRSGQPVVGAIVEIEGTRLIVMADAEGRYRIDNVPAGNRTLLARRLGYAPARQAVTVVAGQNVRADLELAMTGILLDEVVVTGTAGGRAGPHHRELGGPVDAAEAMELARAPDLTSLLNARAPGVRITQVSGRVGTSSVHHVRGRSSLGLGNAPMIYIDGVRVNSSTGLGAFGAPGSPGCRGARAAERHPPRRHREHRDHQGAGGGHHLRHGGLQWRDPDHHEAGSQQPGPAVHAVGAQYGSMFFRDAENRIPTNYFRNSGRGRW